MNIIINVLDSQGENNVGEIWKRTHKCTVDLEQVRIYASRIAGNKEAIEDVLKDLINTDWQRVFDKDCVACSQCQDKVRYCDAKEIRGNLYCETCACDQKEYHCTVCHAFYSGLREVHVWSESHKCDDCHNHACCFCKREIVADNTIVCESCMGQLHISSSLFVKEKARIVSANDRAKKQGYEANLSLRQWLVTVNDFSGKCAYCQEKDFDVLEHFMPVRLQGGTTVRNCVPSCKTCNKLKWDNHPDLVYVIPRADLDRVQVYLQTR